ncbi:MAG TPA: tetratricopeptide repeat protein [Flavitalea sp.]|nr:tetratricopeptide repeat protein [Flavitalea sp.]
MKKQPLYLVIAGVLLFCIIYFFGRTVPLKKREQPLTTNTNQALTINSILAASRLQLTPSQQAYVSQLEAAIVRGDIKQQHINVYKQLASFWRDSAHLLLPATWYAGEVAKLENSEKSLTFAAQFYLDKVRRQDDPAIKTWMATQAKDLFERALALNPANDSNKIGLGSCYLFGNITSNPMQGVKLVRDVAEKDPDNMYAQFTLGLAAMISGQSDRAIERLSKVAEKEPANEEAHLLLAEAYERKGDKINSIRWYEATKKLISDPAFSAEIDKKIISLK